MDRKDFYRKLSYVIMVACVLTTVACAPQKEEVTGTEVLETERLETEAKEEIESASGESVGEADGSCCNGIGNTGAGSADRGCQQRKFGRGKSI